MCASDFQFVWEWRSCANPKLSTNPLLTRYESPFSPILPLSLSPLSLHLSFPRGDKVILQQSEIRWISSSTDRWRCDRTQHSRAESYQVEGWHIFTLHFGEYKSACRLVNVYLCTLQIVRKQVCCSWQISAVYYQYPPIFIVCIRSYTSMIKKALPYPLMAPDIFRVAHVKSGNVQVFIHS